MPKYTTLALGEEEKEPKPSTEAYGEEDGQVTTYAVGEEDTYTTQALGEEDGGTTSGTESNPFGAF